MPIGYTSPRAPSKEIEITMGPKNPCSTITYWKCSDLESACRSEIGGIFTLPRPTMGFTSAHKSTGSFIHRSRRMTNLYSNSKSRLTKKTTKMNSFRLVINFYYFSVWLFHVCSFTSFISFSLFYFFILLSSEFINQQLFFTLFEL